MITCPAITSHTTVLDETHRTSPVIYLRDHMPPSDEPRISIKGIPQYFKNTIVGLFEQENIDYQNKTFISNHYLIFEDFKNFCIDVENNIFIQSSQQFLSGLDALDTCVEQDILHSFSFMSNKQRPHRILCSSIISNLFSNAVYSYNSGPNDTVIASELTINTAWNIDTTRHLSDNWVITGPNQIKTDCSGVTNYGKNNQTNFNFLYDKLFKNSATSIITEPCFFEKGNMLTEKTLMSIYSGHFMIWPGAWKLPETAEKLGIDVFNDIIDHSYQYIEHPGERVMQAFLKNKEFLNDMALQQKTKNQNLKRLQNNLNLVRNVQQLRENLKNLNHIIEK
jgi:hypothetical protein